MIRSPLDIISEAAMAETCFTNNIGDELNDNEFETMFYDELEEIDPEDEYGLHYTAEMVNIILSRGTYFIEMVDLARFATDNNITMANAVYEVANCNSIDTDKICIVTESKDKLLDFLDTSKERKSKKSKKMKSVGDSIKDLKSKGIKVKKRKSKKKR